MGEEKSDLSRAFSEDGARKTHVGGQALIEGIMMRGKYNWSVAVREPAGGIWRSMTWRAGARRTAGCTGRSCAAAGRSLSRSC